MGHSDDSKLPEHFPQSQYSKGWGKCDHCGFIRPHRELVREFANDVVVTHCKDTPACIRARESKREAAAALAALAVVASVEEDDISSESEVAEVESSADSEPTIFFADNLFPV